MSGPILIVDAMEAWILLLARCALAAVFLVSGIHKTLCYQKAVVEFREARVPLISIFLPATIALHILASCSIILGLYARESALLLAVFTVIATLRVHCFWRMRGAQRLARSRIAMAHLAVVGGLLLLAVAGPGPYTI